MPDALRCIFWLCTSLRLSWKTSIDNLSIKESRSTSMYSFRIELDTLYRQDANLYQIINRLSEIDDHSTTVSNNWKRQLI